jgi:hypothetical protein
MSAKQIKFFGTKAQKAALKSRRKNTSHRKKRRNFPGGSRIRTWTKGRTGKTITVTRHRNRGRKRVSRKTNVGEILTASLSGLNPGRKKMARREKHHIKRTHNRRRHNPSVRTVVRYRSRARRRVHGRRRNPSFFSGKVGKVVGVLGGAAVTSLISANFIPAQFNTGIVGYFASGVVAFAQGKLIGKVTKNTALGDDMVIGGLAYVALRVISDMVPSLSNMLPFKLNGMGMIAPSSFYTPQVNMPGSMSSFVTPAALPAPVAVSAAAMHGLGRGRRVGRVGY